MGFCLCTLEKLVKYDVSTYYDWNTTGIRLEYEATGDIATRYATCQYVIERRSNPKSCWNRDSYHIESSNVMVVSAPHFVLIAAATLLPAVHAYTSHRAFEQSCSGFASELNLSNVKVHFSQYLPKGFNLSLPDFVSSRVKFYDFLLTTPAAIVYRSSRIISQCDHHGRRMPCGYDCRHVGDQ
jgi:hypothetical protein